MSVDSMRKYIHLCVYNEGREILQLHTFGDVIFVIEGRCPVAGVIGNGAIGTVDVSNDGAITRGEVAG